MLYYSCCVAFQLPTFDGLFWTCMFCFVAQALTFLSWGSQLCDDLECTWSSGTGMNLTASLMWVWAGNMIKSFPEALPPRGRGRRRAPVYDDDNDDNGDNNRGGGNNNPYRNPGSRDVYQDEYDEDEDDYDDDDDEVVDFQDDNNQYQEDDGGYDEEYDDDQGYDDQGYDDQGYPEEEQGYEDDGRYVDPYAPDNGDNNNYDDNNNNMYPEDGGEGYDPAFPQDTYETDYEEPQGPPSNHDNEFEPNAEFQNSWRGDDNDMENEEFDSPDANYFQQQQQPTGNNHENNHQELSQEELEFLGTDQGYNVKED